MKKIMLTVAGMLLVSLMAVNAQVQESTDMTQDTTQIQSEQPGVIGEDQSNYTRDMEIVEPTDVPESLRTTLQGAEYTGWEEGKVYRNTTTNEFLIVIGDEDAKVYRFDSNGGRIEDLDAESDNSGSMDSGVETPADNQGNDAGSTDDTQTPGTGTPTDPDTK